MAFDISSFFLYILTSIPYKKKTCHVDHFQKGIRCTGIITPKLSFDPFTLINFKKRFQGHYYYFMGFKLITFIQLKLRCYMHGKYK